MFLDIPQALLLQLAAAFMAGLIIGGLCSGIGRRNRNMGRDPRDSRIRSLEAEHRVAKRDATLVREELSQFKADLEAENVQREARDRTLQEQTEIVETLRQDLKESVIKTRELRTELTDRAEEGVKSEVKLRDIETELSVAHASTDMIATGVLDYSLAPDSDPEAPEKRLKSAKSGS